LRKKDEKENLQQKVLFVKKIKNVENSFVDISVFDTVSLYSGNNSIKINNNSKTNLFLDFTNTKILQEPSKQPVQVKLRIQASFFGIPRMLNHILTIARTLTNKLVI